MRCVKSRAHLSVGPDDRAEKLPRTASSVDPHHAQDLKKTKSAQGGRSENLSASSQTQYDDAGNDDRDVCITKAHRISNDYNVTATLCTSC